MANEIEPGADTHEEIAGVVGLLWEEGTYELA